MEENNQNIKSLEDLNYELGIAGSAADFTPDEEEFPENENAKEIDIGEKKENLNKNTEELDQQLIGKEGTQSPANVNQAKKAEKIRESYVKQIPDKDYSKHAETYDKKCEKDIVMQESKLNPETETQFQAPDPDEPKKKSKSTTYGTSTNMRNKNQPL